MSISELNQAIQELRLQLGRCHTQSDIVQTLDRIEALKDCLIQALMQEHNRYIVRLRAGEENFECDLSGLTDEEKEIFADMFKA
jgi:hypothetical protein